jgi:hypothetical protein
MITMPNEETGPWLKAVYRCNTQAMRLSYKSVRAITTIDVVQCKLEDFLYKCPPQLFMNLGVNNE